MPKIAYVRQDAVQIPFDAIKTFVLDYLAKQGVDLGDEATIEDLVMPDTYGRTKGEISELVMTGVRLRIVHHQSA